MAHSLKSRARTHRGAVGLAGVTVLTGALVATALTSPATASATCASFFGIGSTAQCTSSLTSIAIAIGTGATASATGLFTITVSNGLGNSAGQTTLANADGRFNIAYAGGPNSGTLTHSNFSVGIVQGNRVVSIVGAVSGKDFFNAAVGLGSQGLTAPGATASYVLLVAGNGNLAVDLFGGRGLTGGGVEAYGTLNRAVNVGGSKNFVSAGTFAIPAGPARPSVLSTAFNLFGSGNVVESIPGPLAVAGAIGQTGATVKRSKPGITINGVALPAATAAGGKKKAAPGAASSQGAKSTGDGAHKSARKGAGASKRS
jgi:hypothetical protein